MRRHAISDRLAMRILIGGEEDILKASYQGGYLMESDSRRVSHISLLIFWQRDTNINNLSLVFQVLAVFMKSGP
jgi:hypothetical protein